MLINEQICGLLIGLKKILVSYLALWNWIFYVCSQLMKRDALWKTLSPLHALGFFFLTQSHFAAENPDLFNPNDRGNWSAWAIALLQCRACVRTILESRAENSLFKQQRLLLTKWIHNSLKVIHSLCSLKVLFHCCMAYQIDRRDKSRNRWISW